MSHDITKSLINKTLEEWTNADVRNWLRSINCEKAIHAFEEVNGKDIVNGVIDDIFLRELKPPVVAARVRKALATPSSFNLGFSNPSQFSFGLGDQGMDFGASAICGGGGGGGGGGSDSIFGNGSGFGSFAMAADPVFQAGDAPAPPADSSFRFGPAAAAGEDGGNESRAATVAVIALAKALGRVTACDVEVDSAAGAGKSGRAGGGDAIGSDARNKVKGMIAIIKTEGLGPDEYLEAVVFFKDLLSIESDPPIQAVIDVGVVPRFVDFLRSWSSKLQFEAAQVLTDIAFGSSVETRAVVEAGAESPHDDVKKQAIWALGNVSTDSPNFRDYVLHFGVMQLLLQCFKVDQTKPLIKKAAWALHCFCSGNPQPAFPLVSPALPVLAQLIQSTDEDILTDSCWALSHLSGGSNQDKVTHIVEAGVCPRLVKLLAHPLVAVQLPASECIGNIVAGTDEQAQTILDLGALPALRMLLQSVEVAVRERACFILSNITAGNQRQIEAVLQEPNIVPMLCTLMQRDSRNVRKETCWAIRNVTTGGSLQQIGALVRHNCIPPLCEILVFPDPEIVKLALESLWKILRVTDGGGKHPYIRPVKEAGGLDKIELLASSGIKHCPDWETEEKLMKKAKKMIGFF